MKRIFLTVLFALLALGPAQAQLVFIVPHVQTLPPATIGNLENIRTVAVLSAIGESLTLQNVRFLGNRTKQLDIRDWKVDDQIAVTVRQYLRDRFMFKSVHYDRAALAKIPNGPLINSEGQVRGYLDSVPKDGIDAFIVVRPSLYLAVPGLIGLALERSNTGDTRPVVWANYQIDIFDARTLETLSKAYSRVQVEPQIDPGFAGLYGSNNLKLSDELTLSDNQRAELRAVVYRLVPLSLLATLRALEAGATLPEVSDRILLPMESDQRPFPTISTIGVVSAIGAQLQLEHPGPDQARTTAQADIADWRVDEQIETQVRTLAGRQFTVKDVTVPRDQLASARLLDEKRALSPTFTGLSPTSDVDAYLIVIKHPATTTQIESAGIGIAHQTPAGDARAAVFAHYAVALVNAQTLQLMRAATGRLSPKYASPMPYKSVDRVLWPESGAAPSPEQAEMIRQVLSELLTDSIDETLLRMRLSGKRLLGSWPIQTESSSPSQAMQQ